MLYHALWPYRTVVNTSTDFSPYQLVHGVESVLPVECEIPSLNLSIKILLDPSYLEERLVHLENLNEQGSHFQNKMMVTMVVTSRIR